MVYDSGSGEELTDEERVEKIAIMTEQMQQCARELEFEQAAKLRDQIRQLQGVETQVSTKPKPGTIGSRRRAHGRTRK